MSTISVLPSQIANWLSEQTRLSGIRFITEYPAVKKEIPLKRVTVAVGIGEMDIVDSFPRTTRVCWSRMNIAALRI